jgi:nitrogen fixation/metabolism regulation signal transduction histidine kinase
MGRFGVKLVLLLLLISSSFFFFSLYLVDSTVQVSTATLRGYIRELEAELRTVPPVYRQLFSTQKKRYDILADSVSAEPLLTHAVWNRDPEEMRQALASAMGRNGDLVRLAVRDPAERLVAVQGSEGEQGSRFRLFKPIGATGWTLVVEFAINAQATERFQHLVRKLDVESPHVKKADRKLQRYSVLSFLRFFGGAMLIVTVVGLVFARRFSKRLSRLSGATKSVASGDLDVAVPTRARDEIGQLNAAFNEMVAELRRNRAQIAYLQKISAWQEVARRLAHEIKNPLTPILLSVQQVQEKYDGDDPRYRKLLDEASEIVHEEVDGLRRLVEAFSAFAKLPQVQPEPTRVSSVVDDLRRSLGELEDVGELDWTPPVPEFDIKVDRLLFRRVLLNLVENAYQATQEAGSRPRVAISARRLVHSGVALITLTDNGPGVPDDLRDRVFDPYFTTKGAGTGLGLAIVKKIVLEHGGSIDVETAPEGGSRFTIRVPVA